MEVFDRHEEDSPGMNLGSGRDHDSPLRVTIATPSTTAIDDRVLNHMAHIQLHEGESIENALRRFKRKVLQEDIIKEVKKHAFYLKPGEKKRVKQALARKRARKKIRRQPTEDR